MVAKDGNAQVLAGVDAAAKSLGLVAGMALTQAQALVPGLVVQEADPAGDAAALRRLAEDCLCYAPLAAVDPPNGLWIDISGSAHLYGGESKLLSVLVAGLRRQGFDARAAVAGVPAVAHALARCHADPVCVLDPADDGAGMVAALPISALRLPDTILASLRLLGFERVGALAAAPRAPLRHRFGADLALRLDQITGVVFEPIRPIVPAAWIQARRSFVEPLLTDTAFAAVISHLLGSVCRDLEQASLGCRRLDLLFERVDGSVAALRLGTGRPVRDPRHLGRMLEEKLEQVDPGLGVEAMHLVVAVAEPLRPVQATVRLVESDAVEPDIAPLVDRLANRLGEARVYRLAVVESHVPERAVRRVTALSPAAGEVWAPAWGWPVRILNPPQPVETMALLPDHPPVVFTWRRVRHRVRHVDGPDRIAGEWWRHEQERQAIRDYFRVEDEDGRRFWLFRRGDGEDTTTGPMTWFLQGFF